MTIVEYRVSVPDSEGDIPAKGAIECRPTRRRNAGDTIILPDAFTERLVDGLAVLDLAPTGPDWAWVITERANRGKKRTVAVPASATPIAGSDLVDVDPATLNPAAEPEAAWYASIAGINTSVASALDAAADAQEAAGTSSTLAGEAAILAATAAELATAATDGLAAKADATALAALDATIETRVEDAVEAHTPGMELGYAESFAAHSTTNVYDPTGTALIPGLSFTIVGQGRPIDVEFFASGLWNDVTYADVIPFVAVNGDALPGVSVTVNSLYTNRGPSALIKRRIVLTNGVSYTFTAGMFGSSAGTCRINANEYGRNYLSAVSR